jgi:predicted RNase H-like HicB family nuclease
MNVRVTPDEKMHLEAIARAEGYTSAAEYLRARGLAKRSTYTYTVVIHPAKEGGFWAEVPALQGCNTQGETYEETLANAREAILCWIEAMQKLGRPIPSEKQPRTMIKDVVRVAV